MTYETILTGMSAIEAATLYADFSATVNQYEQLQDTNRYTYMSQIIDAFNGQDNYGNNTGPILKIGSISIFDYFSDLDHTEDFYSFGVLKEATSAKNGEVNFILKNWVKILEISEDLPPTLTLTIPDVVIFNEKKYNVVGLDSTFYSKSDAQYDPLTYLLHKISFGNNIKTITSMFRYASAVEEIWIGLNTTKIDNYAFFNLSNVKIIRFRGLENYYVNGVQTKSLSKITEIGDFAFFGLKSLTAAREYSYSDTD